MKLLIATSLVFLFLSPKLDNVSEPDCHETLDDFGKVEIFGHFAHDLGCRYNEMKIDGKKYDYKKGTAILAQKYMAKNDTRMLMELVDRVYLQHSSIMFQSTDEFKETKEAFLNPTCTKSGSDYLVEAWVHEPAQSLPVENYTYTQFIIDKAGNISAEDSKTVSRDL